MMTVPSCLGLELEAAKALLAGQGLAFLVVLALPAKQTDQGGPLRVTRVRSVDEAVELTVSYFKEIPHSAGESAQAGCP